MAKQALVNPHVHVRPGEGTYVDVEFRPSGDPRTAGTASVRVNLAQVPVPNKRYSADVASLQFAHGTYRLLFGQQKLGGDGQLRTLLIVKMSKQAVRRFLESVESAEPAFHAAIALREGTEGLIEICNEPKETVAFDANFVLAAVSDDEGCMDFYHSSPFSVSASSVTKKIAFDPVVRVDLPASVLLKIVDSLRDELAKSETDKGSL